MALTPRAELLRFLRFALVGGAGFLIDAALLTALHHGANIDAFTARLISIAAAALATWRLNRAMTFGASPLTEATEGLRYATVALLAAGLNYALYAAALLISADLPPVVAAIGATFVTMIVSYAGYSRFVFAGAATTVLGSPSSQRR